MRESAPRSALVTWLLRLFVMVLFAAAIFGLDRLLNATIVDYWYRTFIRIAIYVILSASLNLVNGVTGQFSLGHAGFMVIGAYTGGALTLATAQWTEHSPGLQTAVFVAGLLCGAILAAVAGLIVGLPSLRLRGDYLAIATLGFGEITRVGFQACERLGGATGLSDIPTRTNLFWALSMAVITIVILRNLQRSGPGRDFLAVREDEIAAASVGVDVVRTKVVAFVTAAAFAGMAGSLLIHLNNGITPRQAGFMNSIEIVVMVVLGGMGSLTGAVCGAIILVLYRSIIEGVAALNNFSRFESLIYPVLLILLMLLRRDGILGHRELSWRAFANAAAYIKRFGRGRN